MDYDSYSKTYPESRCRIRTSQTGERTLETTLEFRGEGEESALTNDELRRRIRTAWHELLGPAFRNNGSLKARVLEEEVLPNYVRRKVEYEADPGEPVRAWLFLPKTVADKKVPAILCLHQTVREGKDQAAGFDPEASHLAFGPLLAERGYVTLCPDAICFGERYHSSDSFYCNYSDALRIQAGNEGRSLLAKMADDSMRAVDYLVSLPQVDHTRIASMGHSHGGYATLFAMAFDERIKAGVVSCGFTCFRSDPFPERWYRRTALMPRLGDFEGKIEDAPVDFHHLCAAIAPRGLLLCIALKDNIFPDVGDVKWIEEDVRKVYAREGSGESFEVYTFDGEHGFPIEARDHVWRFLDEHLHNYETHL